MRRTGILALGAVLLALLVVPQANAAISVGAHQQTASSEVHQVTFDRWHADKKKHKKKVKHFKKHKKHKKHHHD